MLWSIPTIMTSSISAASSSPLLTGIVSYWKLDESSGDAIDSADGNDGTLHGGITQGASGKINTAYLFDGSGTWVDMGSSLIVGTSSWSISLWIKMTSASRSYFISWGAGDGHNGIRIESGSDFFGSMIIGTSSTINEHSSGLSIDMSDGEWHHVVGTFDRTSNMIMYIDGNAGTSWDISGFSGIDISNSTNFLISDNFYYAVVSGYIDEVGLWNRVLTSDEVATLYNSGTGKSYPF